ncbi:winged helix-turn-helix domain-containing protein [Myxococcus xanthus]|uniref:winged helix-turn-helix domain-containing protein n=1 Tax=Myxococcus xanthus TaxID=34 RepID=UPI0020A5DCFC|nr:winged helix-turn-helix domain-containing protein [Myxococcus xanthus]
MMRVGTTVTTVDAAGMRAQNSSLLLNMIWRERQLSRAELARRTELSPSTVSAIVADLERSGLVRSIARRGVPGRPSPHPHWLLR